MSYAKRILVLNYGMGNLKSVCNALNQIDCEVELIDSYSTMNLDEYGGVVLPGVGAFPRAMKEIEERNFKGLLQHFIHSGKPLLGICLGMQLLFEQSSELGMTEGLGFQTGIIKKLPESDSLKCPHMGWERVRFNPGTVLYRGIEDETAFYFVHSYCAHVEVSGCSGKASFGNSEFCASFESENLFGVQFHPEKSGSSGLSLLKNFADYCGKGISSDQ